MQSRSTKRTGRAFALALAAALAAALFASAASTQTAKKPISRKGLVDAVKINGLSTAELVQQIQARGVAFEMTADAEAELRSVGARPEIIEAARANYRPPATATAATSVSRPATPAQPPRNNTGAAVPSGPPLSKNEI